MALRPLAEPLPPTLQFRGRQALEALAGLDACEQLELAFRTVLGVLKAARPRFEGSREAFDALSDAVEEWFHAEVTPLRFAWMQ
jgi:hypothetical protein